MPADADPADRPWWWVGGSMFPPPRRFLDRPAIDRFFAQPLLLAVPPDTASAAGDGRFDDYGFPLDAAAGGTPPWSTWIRSCVDRARPAALGPLRDWFVAGPPGHLHAKIDLDRVVAAALPATPTRHPGALAATRAAGITGLFEDAANIIDPRITPVHVAAAAGAGLRVYDAPLYWIPGRSAAACLTSKPPDDDLIDRIELPFPAVLVGFAEPVPLEAVSDPADHLVVSSSAAGRTGSYDLDPYVEAIWLAAGPDGSGLSPVAVWFLRYGVGPDAGTGATAGVWVRSTYAGAVPNLAALLSWERWNEPDPAPPQAPGEDQAATAWRRAVKHSAVRRAAQRGQLHRVRVLDIPSTTKAAAGDPDPEAPGRRPPHEHLRRGHWTRVRVATRDDAGTIVGTTDGEEGADWHYEGRWIRPVIVNLGGPPDPGVKVYRLG